tara:strand:- start:5230 stop:6078 length:849 start_codon:yes stop_codon:yes gene_type:complete
MPLDFTAEELIPEDINFPVVYEDTHFHKSKYVINGNTGEYLGIVGKKFKCASHGDFFTRAHNAVSEQLGEDVCDNMNLKFSKARNNAWVMMEMVMPNVLRKIETDKHTTTIAPRLIALHGIDGSCSNQVYYGAIDFFCTNGMITGDYDKIKRKNTTNFDLGRFIGELEHTIQDFNNTADAYQKWAETKLYTIDVSAMLKSIMSDEKAEKMFSLYNQETVTRGRNVWALYSAFTSYANPLNVDTNGFALRRTGNDTQAQSLWKREQDVAGWINTPQFREMVAA